MFAPATRCKPDMAMPTGLQHRNWWQMLPTSLERFIFQRKIDSFHVMWFLLFLHQHSHEDMMSRDYVRQVTFAVAATLDEAVDGLRDAAFLVLTREVQSLICHQCRKQFASRTMGHFPELWTQYFDVNCPLT